MKKIDPTILRELIEYAPETGRFRWRFRDRKWFDSDRVYKSWNTKWAGKEAFTNRHPDGHLQGRIFGVSITGVHRVAWAIYYGQWPKDQIDHINGNPADNRIENLRDVPLAENRKNLGIRRDNSSGRVGVYWDNKKGKWGAGIGANGKFKFLGNFSCFTAAGEARKAAEIEHGYHENHGSVRRAA